MLLKTLWLSHLCPSLSCLYEKEALIDTLPKDVSKQLKFGKELTGIQTSDSGGIEVKFADGSSDGPFDMVVGCDGIKSAVKEYVESGKISATNLKEEGKSAIYSGIRIRYAVDDGDALRHVATMQSCNSTLAKVPMLWLEHTGLARDDHQENLHS